jgi:Uma2 family endonuclease
MAVAVRTRRFNADEYLRMVEVGILSYDDRVELIDGEVLSMTPIGPRHSAAVDRATRLFVSRFGADAIVRVQGPVRLNLFTEPEPDVLVLRPRDDFYASAHPGPAEVLLVVEVADASLDYDRDVKAFVYAQSGVPEYWVLDLNAQVLLRHTSPADGAYRHIDRIDRDARIAPQQLPHRVIPVGDLIVP